MLLTNAPLLADLPLLATEVIVSGGSEVPVQDPSPAHGIHAAVHETDPGSLEPGKRADLAT